MNLKSGYKPNYFSIVFISIFLNTGLKVQSQDLLINEFVAKNSSTISDNMGEFDDWIEIRNTTNAAINLSGYFLSDDPDQPSKQQLLANSNELTIASNGFLLFWADKDTEQGSNHLNFKLSADSGTITLSSPSKTTLHTVSYKLQSLNISYGLSTIETSIWKYFSIPTPNTSNTTSESEGICTSPQFNLPSGYYIENQQVNLSTPGDETIHYTQNSIDPSSGSTTYTMPISINSKKVVRSISTHTNWVPSAIQSEFYLFGPEHKLPILSIITDSTNFWGSNGIYDHPDQTGDSWEKFCQLKFFDANGLELSANAGIRIQGASSVFMDKKSFRLLFKSKYGTDQIKSPIFGENYYDRFDKLVLKSGYDDDITSSTGTLLRDALSTELWKQLGGIPQLSAWKAVYVNDRYWGIYNMRESIDETYIEDHTGFTDFDMVRFHNEGPELKHGTMDDWNALYDFVKTADLSISTNYDQVASTMDLEAFSSLMSMVQCEEYYSWAWGISMYKNNNPVEKWKFSIWDTDRAFTNKNWDGFSELKVNSGYQWANTFYKQLIKNPEFKRIYINRMCDLVNSVYKSDNAIRVLDSIYSIIQPEMSSEIARWNPDNIVWENNVEKVREFLRDRPGILLSQIKSEFSLTTLNSLTLDVNGFGTIKINQYQPMVYPWQGEYFKNNDINVEAIPAKSNSFIDWEDGSTDPKRSFNLTDNQSLKANFTSIVYIQDVIGGAATLTIYPNPSVSEVTLSYFLNKPESIKIELWNGNGQFITSLFVGMADAGQNQFHWNCDLSHGNPLDPGVYFLSMQTGRYKEYVKFIRIQ